MKRFLGRGVPLRYSNPDPVYFKTTIVHVDLSSLIFTLLNYWLLIILIITIII